MNSLANVLKGQVHVGPEADRGACWKSLEGLSTIQQEYLHTSGLHSQAEDLIVWRMPFMKISSMTVCIFLSGIFSHAQGTACPAVGEEFMAVEGNAPIVTLQFKRQDGTIRAARFVFDSGGGAVLLDSALASDLGLKPIGAEIEDAGERFAPVNPPRASIGTFRVSLGTSKAFIHLGTKSFDTRERVEGLLPGKALERYQVVLDYPKHLFSIAAAGCIRHKGSKVDSPFLPASGHPRISVNELNKKYGLLLDTGSRVTLARRDLLESWIAAHPEWPTTTGASGEADMPGGDGKELLLRVPEMEWGPFHIKNFVVVSRPNETYSSTTFETTEAIVGALGGNVLDGFRVEIDYPHGTTYLEQAHQPDANDMNSAGLILDIDIANQLVVLSVSATADEITKKNVLPGDIILQIEGKSETPWTITEASQALSGTVGETRRLLIRRRGMEIDTSVIVAHLL